MSCAGIAGIIICTVCIGVYAGLTYLDKVYGIRFKDDDFC